MADDILKGISQSTQDETTTFDETRLSKLAKELEVSDLDDLLDLMDEDIEELEGISTQLEADGRTAASLRERLQQQTAADREEILQSQLEELEGVSDDTELLKRVAANISTTNNLLEGLNERVNQIETSRTQGFSLLIKDTDAIEFDRAQSSRDLVGDDDKSSKVVLVKANANNSGDLFIGEDGVDVGNGFRVEPGERYPLPINVLPNKVQIVSEDSGDKYTYLSLGAPEVQ